MSSKQDLAAARTPGDIERKYNFGKTFAEVFGMAEEAQKAAEKAQQAADNATDAVGDLDQDVIFNLLTNNGEIKGLFMKDGQLYINASYLATGVITSADGTVKIDLLNNNVKITTSGTSNLPGYVLLDAEGIQAFGWNKLTGEYVRAFYIHAGNIIDMPNIGEYAVSSSISGGDLPLTICCDSEARQELQLGIGTNPTRLEGSTIIIGGKAISWKDNGDGTFSLVGQ